MKRFEDLFYSQGVDIIFEAHEHSYERSWPVFNGEVHEKTYSNPTAPIHIISASAGCNDLDGLCLDPILGPAGKWAVLGGGGRGDGGGGGVFTFKRYTGTCRPNGSVQGRATQMGRFFTRNPLNMGLILYKKSQKVGFFWLNPIFSGFQRP